ncbi:Flagellar hook-associated protein 2 [Rubripirellula lacrimiformis]|uniref:Filament cap protein n=1 Tax=Rubripirellula lacrimiformis TaxID=1930273 RepID=A0A517NBN4_9BACT|nr:flagellar filament capping protein FliD [Rubripirellula lacrimiformis]QDT04549.1 Flagellar hook-associated protein 2 [Rubripirellula lacrimiformis]
MGRLQSSVGLITGTNITGTVDQLIAISGQSRDRLVSRTETLQQQQQSIAELTASVIGVQLAGQRLASSSSFQSKSGASSNEEALSVQAGNDAKPATHVVRTIQTAATHAVSSRQRFDSAETELGFTGQLKINPSGGFIDSSAELSKLNDGRGVQSGTVRFTDRSGASAEVDFANARTIDDVLQAINDAEVDIQATTENGAIKLVDKSGSTLSNLKVEQLGDAETAADLGLWGIDDASSSVSGLELELPAGVSSLRGTNLSELGGGNGIGPLGNLDIELSDGSSASLDLSSATTTSEIIDTIEAAGLSLIVKYNDAKNGLQIRDVSGGAGNLQISSSDDTASDLGLAADTPDDIVVGKNLSRQTVTTDTLLADMNQGAGVKGSFKITDSTGAVSAINITGSAITTVGGLVDAINDLNIGVTASINDAGDGIAIVDTASGSDPLTIVDTGTGTAAKSLGIAGTATTQDVGGSSVSALVGTQAGVIDVESTDSLSAIVDKINSDGRYGTASIQTNDDGTFSLRVRSNKGGEAGKLAINTTGFGLDLQTESRGRDAMIAVSTDEGLERFIQSSDGVFDVDGAGARSDLITSSSLLSEQTGGASSGSFTITDSAGVTSAVNIKVEGIETIGGLVEAINNLGIGVSASINEAGTGISIVDTAGGDETMTVTDVGNGIAAKALGIAGEASEKTIGGEKVNALVGPGTESTSDDSSGLVFTLKELSDSPITITVAEDTSNIEVAAKTFVDQYNKLMDKVDSLTFFNADTNEVGLMFGSSETQRIRTNFSRMLSGSINGAGELRSIGQVGISFDDKGRLSLDKSKLNEALSENRQQVEAFFTTEDTGLAQRIDDIADRIAGVDGGLLLTRSETITTQIERNGTQIDSMNSRLERERERLLTQFYATETAISKLQSNGTAIDQIQRIEIPS